MDHSFNTRQTQFDKNKWLHIKDSKSQFSCEILRLSVSSSHKNSLVTLRPGNLPVERRGPSLTQEMGLDEVITEGVKQ